MFPKKYPLIVWHKSLRRKPLIIVIPERVLGVPDIMGTYPSCEGRGPNMRGTIPSHEGYITLIWGVSLTQKWYYCQFERVLDIFIEKFLQKCEPLMMPEFWVLNWGSKSQFHSFKTPHMRGSYPSFEGVPHMRGSWNSYYIFILSTEEKFRFDWGLEILEMSNYIHSIASLIPLLKP